MDASRPLLEKECDGYESHHQKHHRRGTNGAARNGSLTDPSADCLSRLFPPTSSVTSDSSGQDSFGSGGPFASPTKNNGYHHHHHHHDSKYNRNGFGNDYEIEKPSRDRNVCSEMLNCTEWFCWKWIFPERIMDYDDFATSAQMGEIYYIRQKARELLDPAMPDDEEMLHHLWNGLFPMLPYEGRVNLRWRDVGFQNDDPDPAGASQSERPVAARVPLLRHGQCRAGDVPTEPTSTRAQRLHLDSQRYVRRCVVQPTFVCRMARGSGVSATVHALDDCAGRGVEAETVSRSNDEPDALQGSAVRDAAPVSRVPVATQLAIDARGAARVEPQTDVQVANAFLQDDDSRSHLYYK
ncbi:Engulfment and cell motility elm family protein, partial [Globisporangium splendens]